MTKPPVIQFIKIHKQTVDTLRAGQRFCNMYIAQPWPELYHEADEPKALRMISQWLDDHNYISCLPPIIKETK